MNKDLVIGLDCGTSAVKALVWDREGQAVGRARESLSIQSPRPLLHEQDADSWWKATCTALREATAELELDRIAALSISHQRESFVPVDARGKPLCPALLWMDDRGGELLGDLETRLGGLGMDRRAFRAITGKTLSANLSLAKMEWLRRNKAELYHSASLFLDTHAFLSQRLTGRAASSWGSADPTGLFDLGARCWNRTIMEAVELREDQVPEALAPGSIIGGLSSVAAKATGLPEGLPVVAGLGDGQAAGLGSALTERGSSYLSLGTSIVTGTYSEEPLADTAFRSSFGGIPDSYFLETVILAGAHTVEWLLSSFAAPGSDSATLEGILRTGAEKLEPGSEGLLVVPYWGGAMNPYWDSKARGITVGWTRSHSLAHFYRAILEGLAFELRLHSDGVEKAMGKPIERYLATGGGAQNELWLRIIADVTGRSVHHSLHEDTASRETASLGAGILAAAAAGLYPSIAEAAAAMGSWGDMEILPDGARKEKYDKIYETRYLPLYPALRDSLKVVDTGLEGAKT